MNKKLIVLLLISIVIVSGCIDTSTEENDEFIEALEHLNNAEEYNNEAIDELVSFEEDRDATSASAVERRVDNSEEELEEVDRTMLDESNLTLYDNLENSNEYILEAISLLEAEEEALNSFETAITYFDIEEYGSSMESLQESETHLDSANDSLNELESISEDFEEDSELRHHDLTDILEDYEGLYNDLNMFIGFMEHMNEGFEAFEHGMDLIEAENYTEASLELENAVTEFEDAENVADEDEVELSEFETDFIELRCLSNEMVLISNLALEGAEAGEEEDYMTLNEKLEEIIDVDEC